MTKFVEAGASIEGNKSDVFVRKVSKTPTLLNIDGVGRFYKYKSKIRAIVKITEELVPKIHRICERSNLNLHDELEAVTIEIFTENRISLQVISNFSNVHGIQANNINAFTYAKIVIPWRFVVERGISGHPAALNN
jgi:hypothetical protein